MTDGPRIRVSYAQNGEDVRAWRALRDVEHPFYVEVGASHPFDDSLTAALSAEGWHGLLIEPEPAAADLLRASRPRDVVVAAAAHSRAGVLTWNDLGSRGRGSVDATAGMQRTVSVPAVRVTDLLDDLAPDAVHFMSIDVEGHEEQALRGLDLDRWRPWVLCVEATLPGSRETSHEAWEQLLVKASYQFVTFDGLNRWYVSPEHLDLTDAVAEPFGVLDVMLDRWQRRDVVDLGARLVEVTTEVERLRDEHQNEVEQAKVVRRRLNELERTSTQQLDQLEAQARQLTTLQRDVDLVSSQRAAAVARERVMLESKSWRITSPLRGARRNATTAAASRRGGAPAAAITPPAPRETTPADQRRQRALLAKVAAAASRRAL